MVDPKPEAAWLIDEALDAPPTVAPPVVVPPRRHVKGPSPGWRAAARAAP